jgi:hypothetical protein
MLDLADWKMRVVGVIVCWKQLVVAFALVVEVPVRAILVWMAVVEVVTLADLESSRPLPMKWTTVVSSRGAEGVRRPAQVFSSPVVEAVWQLEGYGVGVDGVAAVLFSVQRWGSVGAHLYQRKVLGAVLLAVHRQQAQQLVEDWQ